MIRLLFLLAFLLPSSAVGQTVAIQSGEHASFSRLVLALPAGTSWKMGRIGRDYAIELDPAPSSYDLSQIFEMIPRDRLAEATESEGRLILRLACEDCHTTAFRWQDRWLVVDVADGPAPDNSQFEASLGSSRPGTTVEREVLQPIRPDAIGSTVVGVDVEMEVPEAQSSSDVAEATIEPVSEDPDPSGDLSDSMDTYTHSSPQDRLPDLLDRTDGEPLALPSSFETALELAPQVSEMETALIEGLARAASQGLLNAANAPLPGLNVAAQEDIEPVMEDPAGSDVDVSFGVPGIAARTSVDRDRPEFSDVATNASGEVCMDEALFNVGSWADDRPFYEQLAEYRGVLTSETGDLEPEHVLSMSRLYVHFGFGLEALSLIEKAELPEPESQIVETMARIVDDLPQKSPLLAGQEDCPSDVALWAVLASGDALGGAEADPDSVLQTLRRLPASIRGHLGQRLAEKFAEFGDAETAAALSIVARGGITASPQAAQLIEASIADHAGDRRGAIRELSELARDDPRMTPEDLIHLIDLSIDDGRKVSEEVIELAEVMRFEFAHDDEIASSLLDAEIRAWLNNGIYQMAIELVAEAETLPDEIRLSLISQAVSGITADASDDGFLQFAFGDLPATDGATENTVARRLISMGFYERAEKILRADARREVAADRRLLRAEIALGLGRFDEVETLLTGLSDDRSQDIRMAALVVRGDHLGALALSESQESDTADETLLAWRAEAWSRLKDSEVESLSELAEVRDPSNSEQQISGENVQPLAERRALVSESAGTRDLVLDLLGNFPVQADGEETSTN